MPTAPPSTPDRQTIPFNSTVDALKFMIRQGWEVVSFSVTGTGDSHRERQKHLFICYSAGEK